MTRVLRYRARLLKAARKAGIAVKYLDTDLDDGRSWQGFYLFCRALGPGIAVNRTLSQEWQVWALAHELGHHFGHLQGNLFSPFAAVSAHAVDSTHRARPRCTEGKAPDESRASAWAADFLIAPEEWAVAEAHYPCDLSLLARELELPLPAAVAWERAHRGPTLGQGVARVPLTGDQRAFLRRRKMEGHGGHQSFFARVLESEAESSVQLTQQDFLYAREGHACTRGGWRQRYQALMDAIEPLVRGAGGVRALFAATSTPRSGDDDASPGARLQLSLPGLD